MLGIWNFDYMSIIFLIVILLLCLLLEVFFSGSEMAVVNADKYKLALATDSGSARARSALHLVKHPATFFATTLFGTNLCTVTGSVVTTLFIIDRFGAAYAPFAILYWPFTLIIGEIVPKSVCQHYADRIILRIAPVLLGVSFALYPIVFIFSRLTDLLLGRIKKKEKRAPPISRDELELMLEMGSIESSDVRQSERTLISRLFDLADKRVGQIMTPLVDVISVPINASREDAARIMDEHGFSRVPVIDKNAFNIVGVLIGTDLLFEDETLSVRELMKPVYFVPEDMPLDDLFVTMKRKGMPLAVVVDEFGAATGIATVEDLLEEVVGEIRDEHDEVQMLYTRVGRHKYILSGRLEVEQANSRFLLGIPEGDYQTIAGFVTNLLERIPKVNETFKSGKYIYRITRATDRAVLEVEASKIAEKGEAE